MVSGASGIDLFLLVIAADDGVMPQTMEHIRVLQALEVRSGLVAVTKADLADPRPTLRAAAQLLPQAERVACSARTGHGLPDVAAALDRVAAGLAQREARPGEAVLHVDRAFTIRGAGTVVTGTLWSGSISRGDRLRLLPSGRTVRVRGVHVHDQPVTVANAGQRVAVNLTGLELRQVSRGDVLVGEAAPAAATFRLEAQLTFYEPVGDGERVQVHHGTRHAPARLRRGEGGCWQLRLERPLIAAPGDHLVIRRISPPGTVAGGTILRAPGALSTSTQTPLPAPTPRPESGLDAAALALEERLRAAGAEPLAEHDLDGERAPLRALQAAGRAVRVGRMYAHEDAVARVRGQVEGVIGAEGSITLARLRDELGTSRKYAQAFLEHFDAARVTRRRPDDSRVLRGELG
jgi:selenocysteine-specific elongation factor